MRTTSPAAAPMLATDTAKAYWPSASTLTNGRDDQPVKAADEGLHQPGQRHGQADPDHARIVGHDQPIRSGTRRASSRRRRRRRGRARRERPAAPRPTPATVKTICSTAWASSIVANSGSVACARRKVAPWNHARSDQGGDGNAGQDGPPERIRPGVRRRRPGPKGAVAEQLKSVASGCETLGGGIEPAVNAVAVRRRLDLEAAAGAKADHDQILLADAGSGTRRQRRAGPEAPPSSMPRAPMSSSTIARAAP